jgi:hypothetical protein
MRVLVAMLGMFAICACAASDMHVIDGARTKFCIPTVNRVANIPWVPEGKPGTPSSFAFSGCAAAPLGHAKDCGTPPSVVGGVVEQKSSYRSQRWGDIDAGSTLKKIVLSPGAELKSVRNGEVVIVHNEKVWKPDWFVWKKSRRLVDRTKPRLEDNDILLTSCHSLPESPIGWSGAAIFDCDRSVRADDYALQYTYRSGTLVPADIESLDLAMISSIDQWRCN